MESFNIELSRITNVLLRSDETELDYSLKDAERLIKGIENPPKVTLVEKDRLPMRDISMTVQWENHSVSVVLVASERYFSLRNSPIFINGKLTDWTWNSMRDKFEVEADEDTRIALWEFYTAITNVL